MTSPLPSTYYGRPGPPRPARPSLAGRHEIPTVIVGGGLAGLATALSLADRGQRPLLLEAARVGAGASGRSGGFVHQGFPAGVEKLERRLGRPAAQTLSRLSRDGVALVRTRMARHGIDGGPVDGVLAASFFDDPAALDAERRLMNEHHGAALEVWPRAKVRDLYRSPRYFDGLYDPDAFHLDPLALCGGYAAAAEAAGAVIHESTPVTAIARDGAGWRVTTPGAVLRAERVVLAQSAYPPAVWPALARAVLPVFTTILVTEPLGGLAATAIRAAHAVYDDRFATGYYRLLPDGALLWGGRISITEHPRRLEAAMRRDLAFVYPQLSEVKVAYLWSGRMGFTRHRMPLVGEIAPGLWAATGFGGQGMATTTMAGELIAAAIAEGDGRWKLFAPFRPEPVYGALGRLAAQGLWWGHGIRDALRAARHRRRAGLRMHKAADGDSARP